VLVEFDRNGAERFAEITARLVGHKQAILAGGEVQDAPIINSVIPNGQVSISMGLFDPDRQAREAAALATALTVVTLPPGGVVEDQTWVPPASIAMFLVIARLVIGIIGGALVGLLVGITVRATRPVWQQVVRRPAGPFPIKRIAVTMLAPVALLVLGRITLPGINAQGLPDLFAYGDAAPPFSIIELGIGPIIVAHIAVELAMLVQPRWRRFDSTRRRGSRSVAGSRYSAWCLRWFRATSPSVTWSTRSVSGSCRLSRRWPR